MKNWKQVSKEGHKKNRPLKKQLHRHKGKALNRLAEEVHHQIFEQIDCLECAACCSGIPAMLTTDDIQRIAPKLGYSYTDFQDKYLQQDEDGDLVFKNSPCLFLLQDKRCSIYEFRPNACRTYPHTDHQFSKNINYHIENSQYCPASFHILAEINSRLPD